jgi:hypothetical protein
MRYLLACLLLSVPACGCGPSDTVENGPSEEARALATKLCGVRHECGCADDRFASHDECREMVAESFDARVKAGAMIDSSCVDDALTNASLNGCPTWVWDPEMWSCPALVKPQKAGALCSLPTDLEPLVIADCDEGLLCLGGVCTPADEQPPAKVYSSGDPCTPSVGCGVLYCGYDHRCHERVPSGGSCNHPYGCEVPLFCEGLGQASEGVCTEQKQPSEACDPRDWNACASPDFPDEVNACDPDANACAPDQPGICRVTHALIAKM